MASIPTVDFSQFQWEVDDSDYLTKWNNFQSAIDTLQANINQFGADSKAEADNAIGIAQALIESYEVNVIEALRRKATLSLRFERGEYFIDDGELIKTTNPSDILSVSRASPKWSEAPSGMLREFSSNTVARQWRNGASQGVSVSGSRTNEILWSQDVTQWNALDGLTITADPARDWGDIPAYEVDVTGSPSSLAPRSNSFDRAAGVPYSFSVYLRKGSADFLRIRISQGVGNASAIINLNTLEVTVDQFGGITEASESGGVIRININGHTLEDEVVGGFVAIVPVDAGGTDSSPSGSYYFLAAQAEVGENPGGYIPATDSPATRAADEISRILGGEFNPSGFTVFGIVRPPHSAGHVCEWAYASGRSDRLEVRFNSQGDFRTGIRVASGGAGRPDTSTQVDAASPAAFAWSIGDRDVVCANGELALNIENESSINLSLLSLLSLGARSNFGGDFLNSNILDFFVVPQECTEAQLIEVTSP